MTGHGWLTDLFVFSAAVAFLTLAGCMVAIVISELRR